MAITFDAATKRIILDAATVSAQECYSRWCDWIATGDNAKYLPAFRAVGGDDLGGGLFIPPYYFLLNGWRIRPMEANHLLVLSGNLFVDGGGQPVVQTLGSYNVSVQYTVPVQAQAFSTTGGGGGLTTEQATQLAEIYKIHGLQSGSPLVVTPTTRTAGDVAQTITEAGDTVTVER